MLHERDKRVHGLKPFQALVDAAPAGSTLKPPPGTYAGPVPRQAARHRRRRPGDHRRRRQGHGVLLEADGAVLRGLTLPAPAIRTTPTTPASTCAATATPSSSWSSTTACSASTSSSRTTTIVRGNRISSKPCPRRARRRPAPVVQPQQPHRGQRGHRFARHGGLVLQRQRHLFRQQPRPAQPLLDPLHVRRRQPGGGQPLLRQRRRRLPDVHGGRACAQQRDLPRHRRHRHGHRLQGSLGRRHRGQRDHLLRRRRAPTCRPSSPTRRSVPQQPHRLQRHRHAVHQRTRRQRRRPATSSRATSPTSPRPAATAAA
jgi:hypothetical protein